MPPHMQGCSSHECFGFSVHRAGRSWGLDRGDSERAMRMHPIALDCGKKTRKRGWGHGDIWRNTRFHEMKLNAAHRAALSGRRLRHRRPASLCAQCHRPCGHAFVPPAMRPCFWPASPPVAQLQGQELKISVFNSDSWIKNKILGQFVFELATVHDQPGHEYYRQWVCGPLRRCPAQRPLRVWEFSPLH